MSRIIRGQVFCDQGLSSKAASFNIKLPASCLALDRCVEELAIIKYRSNACELPFSLLMAI